MESDRRKQILVVGAIICIGALAGDKLILSPLVELWRTRAERVAELETSLNKGRLLVDREKALTERWQEMRLSSLPAEVSVAENQVLKSIDKWTLESGLGVASLKLQWTGSEHGFRELEFRAVARGSMEMIARFLYELEKDPLGLKVEEMEIASRGDSGDTLALVVRFTGIVLTEEKQ